MYSIQSTVLNCDKMLRAYVNWIPIFKQQKVFY